MQKQKVSRRYMKYRISSTSLCYGLCQDSSPPSLKDQSAVADTGEAREFCLLHVQVILHESPLNILRGEIYLLMIRSE